MPSSTVHATWCDRFHLVVGSPECSALARELDSGLAVMVFGNGAGRVAVAVVGTVDRAAPPAAGDLADALARAEQLAA